MNDSVPATLQELSKASRLPYSTLYGYKNGHNHNTLLLKVFEKLGPKKLDSLMQEVIDDEKLILISRTDLEKKLLASIMNDPEYKDYTFVCSHGKKELQLNCYAIDEIKNKIIIFDIKPNMLYGAKTDKFYHRKKKEFVNSVVKDIEKYSSFELCIITMNNKMSQKALDRHEIRIRFIGDMLDLDESKLIIL